MQEKLISHSKENLEDKIKQYLKQFPIAGYGTHRGVIREEGRKFVIYMYREKSCD